MIRLIKSNGHTTEHENILEVAKYLDCSVDYVARLIVNSKKLPKSISSIKVIKE